MRSSSCTPAQRSRIALGLAATGLLACAGGAKAQNINSGVSVGPSQQLSTPAPPVAPLSPPAPSVEHLFGDVGGLRTYLNNRGIDVLLDVTSEFAGNVSGGVKQGATFASQVGFEVDIDWQKLAGVLGLSTHVVLVNRSGSNDSTLFGDNLLPVQEIYGAGGNVGVHLVYAYAEEKLADGRVDLALGRFPVSNDFAASPLYCNFMNNSLCGNPKALPGEIGFSSYPDAVWAGRARLRPTPSTYVQFGAFEVNRYIYTYPQFRSGFNWFSDDATGAYLPVEVAWEPRFGTNQLPGHYKLGFGYDTSSYPDLYADANGGAAVLSRLPNRLDRGRDQEWALFDQMVVTPGVGRQRRGDPPGRGHS